MRSASSLSYNISWLTNPDSFAQVVLRFQKIMAHMPSLLQAMDPSLEQAIASAVTSAVFTAVSTLQARHNDEMLSLRKMIEKSLLLNTAPPSSTPPSDSKASAKALISAEMPTKASTKRWNQAELGYFDPHLDKAHGEGEVMSVEKNVYYRNVVLFVRRL